MFKTDIKRHKIFKKIQEYSAMLQVKQIASIVHHEEKKYSVRVGSLIFHSLGQLLQHQVCNSMLLCSKTVIFSNFDGLYFT